MSLRDTPLRDLRERQITMYNYHISLIFPYTTLILDSQIKMVHCGRFLVIYSNYML